MPNAPTKDTTALLIAGYLRHRMFLLENACGTLPDLPRDAIDWKYADLADWMVDVGALNRQFRSDYGKETAVA
jgi:hypothetical protein